MSSSAPSRPDHPSLLPALLAADEPADRVRRSARDWAIDVLCFLLAIGFGAFMLWITGRGPRPPHHPPRLPDLIIGSLGCLTLWVRRRRPVSLATTLGVFSAFSATVSGAGCIALFTVAVHRRFRMVALIDESRRAGMTVTWENHLHDVAVVPASIGRSAYRTVQEGLTNARKHAPGAAVRVRVGGSAGAGLRRGAQSAGEGGGGDPRLRRGPHRAH
jgi:hypothetical protein